MSSMIKKLTAGVLIAVLACPILSMTKPATAAYAAEIGDANGSGAVDATDALMVLKHVVKLTSISNDLFTAADVNGDGSIAANDALDILKYNVKIIPYFRAQVTSPSVALELITNHVKTNGEVNEDGTRYIYDWYYDDSDPTITYNWIPEVDYTPSTGELSFHLAYIYDNPSEGTSYLDNVKMVLNGKTGNAQYYVGISNADDEMVMEGLVSTSFDIGTVTKDSSFHYQADTPQDLVIDEDWQALADEGILFALQEWDLFLQSKFNMTLQDLGFSAY